MTASACRKALSPSSRPAGWHYFLIIAPLSLAGCVAQPAHLPAPKETLNKSILDFSECAESGTGRIADPVPGIGPSGQLRCPDSLPANQSATPNQTLMCLIRGEPSVARETSELVQRFPSAEKRTPPKQMPLPVTDSTITSAPPRPATQSPEIATLPPPAPSLLERIRAGLQAPSCIRDRVARRWRQIYTRSPTHFQAHLEQALPLLEWVTGRVHAAGLPSEFALVPLIESSYRPDAKNGDTLGLWQFSSATARAQGIIINSTYDGRLAPLDATDAAIAHLKHLMQRFGHWKLALMAYNAGENRLASALQADPSRASAEKHRPHGLALGTYEYLGKAEALACILAKPVRFQIKLPVKAPDSLQVVPIPDGFHSLHDLSIASQLPLRELSFLNPGFLQGRIDARAPRQLLLGDAQAGRLQEFTAKRRSGEIKLPSPASPQGHRVASGESLWTIARRYGLAVADLLRWNRLHSRSIIRPGQLLRLEP